VLGAAGLVAGSMVGSGVFLLPATLGAIGSISILGWIAATLAALAIAGVFIQLARLAPQARGLPGYVAAGLGRFFGVQTAVVYWCTSWGGLVPIALAGAGAVGFLVPALAPPAARLGVTLAIVWLALGAAWIGPRLVARVEGLTLALGLLPVLLAATAGWLAFRAEVFTASWNPAGLSLVAAVKGSGLNCFWAFLGLECAAAAAAVVRDPVRNVPRATLLGVAGAAALYMMASTVMMGLLPADRLAASTSPFADAARGTLGAGLGAAIAACVYLRVQGCVAGWTLVTAETARTAADIGDFPALFRTRSDGGTPASAILVPGALMTGVAVLSANPNLGQQFSTLINVASMLALYAYALAGASLIRISGARPLPLVTGLVAIAASLALIATARPIELLLSLAPIPAAALLYLWLRRREAARA
jgi:arginine:agmatine antiporter